MPTPWLTYTVSSGTMQSFEPIENIVSVWVFRAKETLNVEGLIDGKVNLDRKVAKSLWRIVCGPAAGGT